MAGWRRDQTLFLTLFRVELFKELFPPIAAFPSIRIHPGYPPPQNGTVILAVYLLLAII